MTVIEAFILGLVQGITEFLPVSSSGHLVLAQAFLGIEEGDLLFDTLVHLGTLISVFVAFHKTIFTLIKEFFGMIPVVISGKFKLSEASPPRRMIVFLILSLLPLFIVFFTKDILEGLYSSVLFVAVALIINSVILFLSDRISQGTKNASNMKTRDSLIVGFAQVIASVPGISRSGSTITAGVFCGLKRSYAAKYSFILSIPTILAAVLLNIIEAYKTGYDFSTLPVYLIAMAAAAVSGFIAVKLLEYILKSRKFIIFALYCFIVGITSIIWYIIR